MSIQEPMGAPGPKSRLELPEVPPLTFLVGGLIALVAAIVAAVHSTSVPPFRNWSFFAWDTAQATAACAGYATVAAVVFAVYQFSRQRVIERSKFALQMAMDGVRRAYAVLTSANPATNMLWVNGARLILHSNEMAKSITEVDDKAAWELFQEEWRIKFHLLIDGPAETYFGLSSPPKTTTLDYSDETLINMMERSYFEPKIKMTYRSGSAQDDTMVSEKAIKVVYEFARFPENYRSTDFLQSVQLFTEAEMQELDIRSMWGVFAYLTARRKFTLVFGGKVHRNLATEEV